MRFVYLAAMFGALLLCGCQRSGPHHDAGGAQFTASPAASPAAVAPLPAVVTTPPAGRGPASTPAPTRPTPPPQAGLSETQVDDLTFIDAQCGWALGSVCPGGQPPCRPALWRTADGGTSWHELGAALPTAAQLGHGLRLGSSGEDLLFGTPDVGWIYGPSYGAKLFATQDGGATWAEIPMRKDVAMLSYADDTLWALVTRTCSPGQLPSACVTELLESTDLGRTWAPVGGSPGLGTTVPAIIRLDRGRAWLFGDQIERTTDGGASWTSLPLPTGCERRAPLPSYADNTLWLVCTDCHANGFECRAVYTSTDGGDSWARAFPPDPFDPHVFTNGGTTSQIAAASAQAAFFCLAAGPAGGPMQSTLDGGRTWNWVMRQPNAGCAGVRFADPVNGWFADNNDSVGTVQGAMIWRTTDGGLHWERHVLP